jgi:cephalosporin-C deacetylase-like acetyl esterase
VRNLILLVILTVILPACLSISDCEPLYQYDDSSPPVVDQTMLAEDDFLIEYRLLLHSVNSQKVPALLSIPKKEGGPFPVVILLHGYGGDKDDLMEAAEPLAQRGYAAVAIDAQYHGERKVEGKNMYSADTEMTTQAFVQTVIDVRRLIDHLETRDDVDASRIGLVGGSMGALLGTIASGVDARIDAVVLIVGGGNMTLMISESQLTRVIEIRSELAQAGRRIEDEAKDLECIDPINFIDQISPRPVLMINGRNDDIVPASSNRALHSKARGPKKIIWYDTGHDVPVESAATNAFFWFEKHLKKRFYLQNWFYLVILIGLALMVVFLARRVFSPNRVD